jgi:hypothetical protein
VLPSEEVRNEIRAKGESIYIDKLKSILEPKHHNEYVAIQVDTGDYALGRSISTAARALVNRIGVDGRVLTRRVGDEPDYLLASRLIAAEGRPSAAK